MKWMKEKPSSRKGNIEKPETNTFPGGNENLSNLAFMTTHIAAMLQIPIFEEECTRIIIVNKLTYKRFIKGNC